MRKYIIATILTMSTQILFAHSVLENAANLSRGKIPVARNDESSVTLKGSMNDFKAEIRIGSATAAGTVTSTTGFVGDGSKLYNIGGSVLLGGSSSYAHISTGGSQGGTVHVDSVTANGFSIFLGTGTGTALLVENIHGSTITGRRGTIAYKDGVYFQFSDGITIISTIASVINQLGIDSGTAISIINAISIATRTTALTENNSNYATILGSTQTKLGGFNVVGSINSSSITVIAGGTMTATGIDITRAKLNGIVYNFDNADGTDGQILKTNGAGLLKWTDDGGGPASTQSFLTGGTFRTLAKSTPVRSGELRYNYEDHTLWLGTSTEREGFRQYYSRVELSTGLMARWDFDKGYNLTFENGGVAISSNFNIDRGCRWLNVSTSVLGYGLFEFRGATNCISIPDNDVYSTHAGAATVGTMTIVVTGVYPYRISGAIQDIVTKNIVGGGGTNNSVEWNMQMENGGQITTNWLDSDGNGAVGQYTSDLALVANTTNTIIVSLAKWRTPKVITWINCAQSGAAVTGNNNATVNSGSPIIVGGRHNGGQPYHGLIKTIRIFDNVPTATFVTNYCQEYAR